MTAAALEDTEKGLAVCKLLIEHQAQADLKDERGFTALHWAAAWDHGTITAYLAQHIDVNAISHENETALHRASRLGFSHFLSLANTLFFLSGERTWCASCSN